MNEMIERVAKAISKHIYDTDEIYLQYVTLAKAAIEAMREPTDEMKKCDNIHWGYSCYVCGGLKDGWYKMIDAALK